MLTTQSSIACSGNLMKQDKAGPYFYTQMANRDKTVSDWIKNQSAMLQKYCIITDSKMQLFKNNQRNHLTWLWINSAKPSLSTELSDLYYKVYVRWDCFNKVFLLVLGS